MTAAALAGRLLAARAVRRAAGCGCLAVLGLVALPVVVLLASLNRLATAFGVGGGVSQVEAGAPGLVAATGMPLPPGTFRVTQGFGCTNLWLEPQPPRGYSCPPDAAHPTYQHFHTGIDMAAATGVLVLAVTAGTVHVFMSPAGFGEHILLSPAQPAAAPVQYLYGHLSGVAVPDGDVVRAGEPIGFVGSTGNSSGSHLHFEVDVGGLPTNPCSVFPAGYLLPAGVTAAGCVEWAM